MFLRIYFCAEYFAPTYFAWVPSTPTPWAEAEPRALSEFGRSLRVGVRCLLYDEAGAPVAEISPQIESIVWRLQGPGTATFRISYRDAACKKDILRAGRRVLFQFENGLPDWGGVLDFPLQQDAFGVKATAFTAERILEYRRTARSVMFDNKAAGAIVKGLIEDANAVAMTGIVIGEFYAGGTAISLEYHLANVWEQIKELMRVSGYDFAITPTITSGGMTFTASWLAQFGEDKHDQVALIENRNAQISALDWQGPVYNRITLAGEGSTWDDTRATEAAENGDSLAQYTLREYAEVQSGKFSAQTLAANAAALVDLYAQPRKRISISALDKSPGLFTDYGIGDVVRVQGFLRWSEWALDDSFRVIAREWKPDGMCLLEVEEWA